MHNNTYTYVNIYKNSKVIELTQSCVYPYPDATAFVQRSENLSAHCGGLRRLITFRSTTVLIIITIVALCFFQLWYFANE